MTEKIALTNLLPEEITELFSLGQKFRGAQIFGWVAKGAQSFDEMTNVSKELRSRLSESAPLYSSEISNVLRDEDGTVKLQIKLHDGNLIETVLLIDRAGRKTACVSSQAGCPLQCAFCKTGSLGFARNLSAAEIVEQFLFLERECGKLDNIVFMGMGEPLLNLENVSKAVSILTHKDGRALSARRITVSTAGVVRGIYALAEHEPPLRLAVSLTTADENFRRELMPVSRDSENNLEKLRESIKYYTEKTGKRVTLEAALLGGKNTDDNSAKQLAYFTRGLDVNVNLIPWNPIDTLPFVEPTANEVSRFVEKLERAGVNVTLRTRRGRNIGGACGQLGQVIDN